MNTQNLLDAVKEYPDLFITEFGYLNKTEICRVFKLSPLQWQDLAELWRDQRRRELKGLK